MRFGCCVTFVVQIKQKMHFRFLLSLIFLLSFHFQSNAQMLGGEITWSCQPNGQYVFQLVRYANCNGNVAAPDTAIIQSVVGNITCVLQDSNFVSLSCPSAVFGISCDTTMFYTPVVRYVYTSAPVSLLSTVTQAGWHFYYTENGRPTATNMSQSAGYTLRSVMYPPNAILGALYTAPCTDHAPKFMEQPMYAFNTLAQATYIEAFDANPKDSLHFEWAEPWDTTSVFPATAIVYDSAYNYFQPLPSISVNPLNENAVLLSSGRLTFRSITTGTFATCVKVESWRNGVLIAEIYRDLQFEMEGDPGISGICGNTANNPPIAALTAVQTFAVPDSVVDGGVFSHFRLEAIAGDTIRFNINSVDFNLSANCNSQLITATAFGSAINSDLMNQQGCNIPPCAQLISLNSNQSFTNAQSNNLRFEWITDTAHIPNAAGIGKHTFFVSFTDDNCILPGKNILKIEIDVLRPIMLNTTEIVICAGDTTAVQAIGDTTNLLWSPAQGLSCTTCANPLVYPATSTTYTATDQNTGFSTTVFVQVDPALAAIQFVNNAPNLQVTNPVDYDTLIWYRNGAPFYAGSTYTPQLAGDYWVQGIKGSCAKLSSSLNFGAIGNIAANTAAGGELQSLSNQSRTIGATFRLQNEPFYTISGIYVHALNNSAQGANLAAQQVLIRDNQSAIVFQSDSVVRISNDLLLFYGESTLGTQQDYFITIYTDTSVQVPLYRPFNFPVVTTNGRLLIFNALQSPGNTSPSTTSLVYPFFHFKLKWHIGIAENEKSALRIYPNPAQTELHVVAEGKFNYSVTDLSGRLVARGSGEDAVALDVHAWSSGMYVIKIERVGVSVYHRIQVSH